MKNAEDLLSNLRSTVPDFRNSGSIASKAAFARSHHKRWKKARSSGRHDWKRLWKR